MATFLVDRSSRPSTTRTLAAMTMKQLPARPVARAARLTPRLRAETRPLTPLTPRTTAPVAVRVPRETIRLAASARLMEYAEPPRPHSAEVTSQPAPAQSWRALQDLCIKAVAVSLLLVTVLTGAGIVQAVQATHPAAAVTPRLASLAVRGQLDLLSAAAPASALLLDTETCHVANTTKSMLTPRQIANPVSHGYRLNPGGNTVPCAVNGLQVPAAPMKMTQQGQVILVSTSRQWLWAYQDGRLVYATPVTTGMAPLRTPHGTYNVTVKESDTTFYSPWPVGSPYYYTPEHINYALRFRDGGFYIHDAPWRDAFGPGTQNPHTDPNGTQETGSHGCVNVTTDAARWLYNWAYLGATVMIV